MFLRVHALIECEVAKILAQAFFFRLLPHIFENNCVLQYLN